MFRLFRLEPSSAWRWLQTDKPKHAAEWYNWKYILINRLIESCVRLYFIFYIYIFILLWNTTGMSRLKITVYFIFNLTLLRKHRNLRVTGPWRSLVQFCCAAASSADLASWHLPMLFKDKSRMTNAIIRPSEYYYFTQTSATPALCYIYTLCFGECCAQRI